MKAKLSIFLCFALILTAIMPLSVFAGYEDSLKQAITVVKEKGIVPDEYTEFNHNMYFTEYNVINWSLNWSTKDNTKNIYVNVDGRGNVINYSKNNYDYQIKSESSSLKKVPVYSKSDCALIADEFFKKMDQNYFNASKKITSGQSEYYSYNDSYSFTYEKYVNGIPSAQETVNIQVNFITGEAISYNAGYIYDMTYTDPKGAISADEAKAAYKELTNMELIYRAYYDKDNNKWVTKLVWAIDDMGIQIDAFTGKKVEYFQGDGSAVPYVRAENTSEANDDKMVAGASGGYQLTSEEQSAVDQIKGLLTLEEADAKIKGYDFVGLDKDFGINGSSLYKSYEDSSKYIWNIYYVKKVDTQSGADTDSDSSAKIAYSGGGEAYASFSIDAKTGELLSFYISDKDNAYTVSNPKPKYTEAEVKAKIEEFINKAASSKKASYKLQDFSQSSVYRDDKTIDDLLYSANYARYENGYKFDQNGIYVSFDNVTGKITNYSISFYDNISFEQKTAKMTKDEVYNKLLSQAGLKMAYEKVTTGLKVLTDAEMIQMEESGKGAPVNSYIYYQKEWYTYKMTIAYTINYNGLNLEYYSPYFDTDTGEMVSYEGKPIKSSTKTSYTDISGHYAEKFISQLYEINIALEGDKFYPDKAATQVEFLTMIAKAQAYDYIFYSEDVEKELYDTLKRLGIVKDNEMNPNAPVSRTDAVKFVIRTLGYEKVAQIDGIYSVVFKDDAQIQAGMKGYFVLCQGLGIIGGTPEGNVLPNKELTRAESAIIIYNLLK